MKKEMKVKPLTSELYILFGKQANDITGGDF